MREISLHLIDIIENSITAGSTLIEIAVKEMTHINMLQIEISDNGCGMSQELLNHVTDPFVTSRTTRKVGLGISLFKSACERCNGNFIITSQVNVGTKIVATMEYDHIDRAPIGRIEDTITTLLLNQGVELVYLHMVNDKSFIFDSREIKNIVGDQLNTPDILMWLKEYISENIENIGGGKW